MNNGSSNRLMYDKCAYQKKLYESTTPLTYQLYEGRYENCNKCKFENQFWRPFDLVDIESDLKNLNRPASQCPQFKYQPRKVNGNPVPQQGPVVFAPDVCPIVFNNIPKMTNPGYVLPPSNICQKL